MKSVSLILMAVAITMTSIHHGAAQPTPPTPEPAPVPVPVPVPMPSPEPSIERPIAIEPSIDQWEKLVELETNRAVHEAATAKAAKAAAMAIGPFPVNINLKMGHSNEPSAKIREAAVLISQAPDEAAREAATANLLKLLDEYFVADMRVREQQLADIQERVQRLMAQLDHRRAKKQEIIDLQFKVAINEAEGLGFYGDRKPGGFDFAAPTVNQDLFGVPDGGKWTSEPSSSDEVPAASATPSAVIPQ